MRSAQDTAARFRGTGQKVTPQRVAIFEYLEGNTTHPSAQRIYDDLVPAHPTLSFTTVYRTLQVLVEMGEVLELALGGERRHYDPNVDCHVHVVCGRCGRIEDVPELAEGLPEAPAWVRRGYRLDRTTVTFEGTCTDCA